MIGWFTSHIKDEYTSMSLIIVCWMKRCDFFLMIQKAHFDWLFVINISVAAIIVSVVFIVPLHSFCMKASWIVIINEIFEGFGGWVYNDDYFDICFVCYCVDVIVVCLFVRLREEEDEGVSFASGWMKICSLLICDDSYLFTLIILRLALHESKEELSTKLNYQSRRTKRVGWFFLDSYFPFESRRRGSSSRVRSAASFDAHEKTVFRFSPKKSRSLPRW